MYVIGQDLGSDTVYVAVNVKRFPLFIMKENSDDRIPSSPLLRDSTYN